MTSVDEAEAVSLEGEDAWLRISIVRYQFPQTENDEWDSNWLIIEGHVSLGGRIWKFSDPCLTTFEAIRLADWMDAQANGTSEQALCAFTEPNLEFARRSDSAIRVRFSHESAPPWAKPHYGEIEYGMNIPVGPKLSMAAEQLRGQLARFPVRGRK